MSLKTDYKDDILAVGNLRKYQMIQNNDGTVSFQDVTQYEQTGDVFGAGDINRTNQAVNEKFDSGDVVDPMETTVPGFAADALAVKNQFNEQNKKIPNMLYGKIENTNLAGYGAKNVTINFENTFSEIPVFVCNFFLNNESSAPKIRASVLNITKEYALVRIANDGEGSYNVGLTWIAIEN